MRIGEDEDIVFTDNQKVSSTSASYDRGVLIHLISIIILLYVWWTLVSP